MRSMIGGYHVAELKILLEKQKRELVLESAQLRREIRERESRLAEVRHRLGEIERSENVLEA